MGLLGIQLLKFFFAVIQKGYEFFRVKIVTIRCY